MNAATLWLRESDAPHRFGLKGPRAAELLRQCGFSVPGKPNTWAPLRARDRDDSPNVIARLGNTGVLPRSRPMLSSANCQRSLTGAAGAYPVLRQDAALRARRRARRGCAGRSVQRGLRRAAAGRKPVVMTLMTGVGVLVLPQSTDDGMVHRIWCDPSFGSYLWETLAEVVKTTIGRAA